MVDEVVVGVVVGTVPTGGEIGRASGLSVVSMRLRPMVRPMMRSVRRMLLPMASFLCLDILLFVVVVLSVASSRAWEVVAIALCRRYWCGSC